MCLVLAWHWGFFARAMAPWLSPKIIVALYSSSSSSNWGSFWTRAARWSIKISYTQIFGCGLYNSLQKCIDPPWLKRYACCRTTVKVMGIILRLHGLRFEAQLSFASGWAFLILRKMIFELSMYYTLKLIYFIAGAREEKLCVVISVLFA